MTVTLTRISGALTGRTRLTRIPCTKCGEDTIHDGMICKTCGHIEKAGRTVEGRSPWARAKRK